MGTSGHQAAVSSASELRRLGRTLGLFLTINLVLLTLAEGWIAAVSTDHIELKYREMYDPRSNPAGIILGTSLGAHGIDPIQLGDGIRWYNYAFNGAAPSFQRDWYDSYRALGKRPSWLILTADWIMFAPYLDRQRETDSEFLPFLSLIEMVRGSREGRKVALMNRFALIKKRLALQNYLFTGDDGESFRVVTEKFHAGYAPLIGKRPWRAKPAPLPYTPEVAEVDALKQLLATLAADDVKVVLVTPPVYMPTAEGHAEPMRLIAEVAREHRLPWLDYTSRRGAVFNQDPGVFVDWGHLNERGSARFSRTLRQDLARLGWPAQAAQN